MPAEAGIGAIHGSAVPAKQAGLQDAVQKLSLQQAKHSSKSLIFSTKADANAALQLNSVSSLPEPSAPIVCTSPRLKQQPAKLDSRAALQAKSPFAQRSAKRLTGQDMLRKSADAVLTTAKSGGSSPKLAARHMRRQSSLDRKGEPAASSQEGIAAAVRRSRMRIEKIGVNRDSAHERRRLEIYALNTIMCASEDAKLQQLIKQHADELEKVTESSETERMLAIAALPDSDDDKYQSNSPRFAKTGFSVSTGAVHKV